MGKNRAYAERLKALEGYERKIIAFKLCDEVPAGVEPYGDDLSFLCAIIAEVWQEGRRPFYVTNKNCLCGGALYTGIGNRRIEKEEFDAGMSQTIGMKRGYANRENFRRINQLLYDLEDLWAAADQGPRLARTMTTRQMNLAKARRTW